MSDQSIAVRDNRLRGFFIVDNHIFSKENDIGPYALLVYCVLCRIATSSAEYAITSRGYIAKLARISTGSVSKGVQELVDAGLISVESQRDGGKNLPSKYTINSLERPSYSDGRRPSSHDGHPMTVTTEHLSKDLCKVNPLEEVNPKTSALRVIKPSVPTVFDFPIVGNKTYSLPQDLFSEYVNTYVGVSVMEELGRIRAWLLSNPTKLKTANGMPRFLNQWLGKSQDNQKFGGSKNDQHRQFAFDTLSGAARFVHKGSTEAPTGSEVSYGSGPLLESTR